MRKSMWFVFLLVTMLFPSGAQSAEYKVKAGDTLSGIAKKHGMELVFIIKLNPAIKNPNHIVIGQIINLPENYAVDQKITPTRNTASVGQKIAPTRAFVLNGKKIETSKPVAMSKSVQQNSARPWDPGSNPWKLSKADGIKRLKFFPSGEKDFLDAVRNDKRYSTAYIHKDGKVFDDFGNEYRMLNMGFGKGDFFQPIPAWKDPMHVEAGWMYRSGSEYLTFPFKCGNPTSLQLVKLVKKPEPSPEPDKKKAPVVEMKPELPPIFKEVPVEKTCVTSEHEFDIGGGIWTNQDSTVNGDWWFAQYKWFLRSCQDEIQVLGGTLTPVVGAFAKGDRGSTDAGYDWNNGGVGPQAGFMWNGQTVKGYPQQIQFMLRAIYFYMHGTNGWSGYSKEQEHILVGYYLEYLRRFHPKYMTILYAEGWFDVKSSFKSTWSGDKANDLTQFVVGAKLHRDLTDTWAARIGAQIGYQVDENRLGANVHAELRYDDWLIFGPSFDYCISSDTIHEAGGWAAGVFARVELKKQITEQYTEYRIQRVSASDKQLLEY